MSEQSAVAHSPGPAAPASDTGSARSQTLLAWSLATAAAIAVAAGGGQLVLAAKPIAGTVGVPGDVVGYCAFTAVLLGALTALAAPRLLRSSAMRAGTWSALGAGIALVLAGLAEGPILFTTGTLLAGAFAGVAYTAARIRLGGLGGRARTAGHAATWLGLLAASLLSWSFHLEPGTGLVIAGAAAAAVALLGVPFSADPRREPVATAARDRPVLFGYGAAGFAASAAITSAGYALAHRWEVLGADQMPLIAIAVVAALVTVTLPLRPASVPLLLVVAAGGLLLVAIAPGSATTVAGLAVTMAAVARAATDLDHLTTGGPARSSANAVCAGGLGLVAGFASAEGLREVTAAGTAITLTALPVLALTAAWIVLAARRAPTSEGDHS